MIARSGWRAGVYVQDEWTLGDSVTATLGLRLDRNNVTGNDLSPRAALIWQATPDTTLKALYGRAHRAPNVYERDFDDGLSQIANPDLEGETIDTLELVIDQRVGRSLSVRGSVYQWSMQGLVTLGTEAVSGLSQYQTGEDVKARGVELSADKTWDWGGRLRGSLSYQDVAYKSGAGLDNAPQVLGKLNFSGPLAATGLRLGYELQYSSERQAIDGTDLGGYWLSNLQLSSDKWVKGLEVSLGLYNLFDTRYAASGIRHQLAERPGTGWPQRQAENGLSFLTDISHGDRLQAQDRVAADHVALRYPAVTRLHRPPLNTAPRLAFLYNFIAFTEWPSTVGSPLTLCVYGADPFGEELAALQGKTVGGRSLATRQANNLIQLKGCQVVFIASPAINDLPRILDALQGGPVLTICGHTGRA